MNRPLFSSDVTSCYPVLHHSTCHTGLFQVSPNCQKDSFLRTLVPLVCGFLQTITCLLLLRPSCFCFFSPSSILLSDTIRVPLNIKLHTHTHIPGISYSFSLFTYLWFTPPLKHKIHKESIYLSIMYPNTFSAPSLVLAHSRYLTNIY